jgi:hypothetical protein
VRNTFERRVGAALPVEHSYEATSLPYQPSVARYTPDWVSPDGKIVVDAKGFSGQRIVAS